MNPSKRPERLHEALLYLVTGARRDEGDLPEFLDAVLSAGVDIVQIREKETEAADVIRMGAVFRDAAERHGALFIVNDRPDVALALEADGVHVGQNDLPVEVARALLGPEAIIGLSTHSPEQLDAAPTEADYVCCGPVWETPTKPGRPAAGLELIRHAAEHERRPWFAIGGINEANLSEVIEAGARRIVVVRAITEAHEAGTAVRHLAEKVRGF
ncbi:MAG: thiamine phosphate synthase [Actinomycetota bacterium]